MYSKELTSSSGYRCKLLPVIAEHIVFKETHHILDLTHRSPSSLIIDFQDTVKFLFTLDRILYISELALDDFCKKKYKKFDALVGENMCQIRAFMVYKFMSEDNHYLSLDYINYVVKLIRRSRNSLNDFIDHVRKIKPNNINKKMRSIAKTELKKFFKDREIWFFLSKEILVVIYLYILGSYTKYNKKGIHTGINYEKICNDLVCSKTFARNIIRKYQKFVSEYSCQFILSLNYKTIGYQHLLALLRKDDDGRSVFPAFIVMKILLNAMIDSGINILFRIYIELTSELCSINIICRLNNGVYEAILEEQLDRFVKVDYPCIVFSGITKCGYVDLTSLKRSFFLKINELGVVNIILANMAEHPQYPGKSLVKFKQNPFDGILDKTIKNELSDLQKELFKMKKMTMEWGCCKDNPSFFLITHIYCDTLDHYVTYHKNFTKKLIDL